MTNNIYQFFFIYLYSIITLFLLAVIGDFVSISIFLSKNIFIYKNIFLYCFLYAICFFAIRIIITNQVSNIFIFIISLALSYFFLINKEINAYQLLIILSVFITFNLLLQKYYCTVEQFYEIFAITINILIIFVTFFEWFQGVLKGHLWNIFGSFSDHFWNMSEWFSENI